MVNNEIKFIAFIIIVALALLFVEGNNELAHAPPIDIQAVSLPESAGFGDFGSAAVAWWNARGDLEQDFLIYGSLFVVGLIILRILTKKGGS